MLDKADELSVVFGCAASRSVFPNGLMAGRGVVEVDALANSGPEHVRSHGRILFQGLERGPRRIRAAVYERRQHSQNIECPLRPQITYLLDSAQSLPRANHGHQVHTDWNHELFGIEQRVVSQ